MLKWKSTNFHIKCWLFKKCSEVTSPKWQHRLFPTSLYPTEQLTTLHRQDTTENPRTWEGGWSTPCTTETTLEGWEEQQHADHFIPPPGLCSTTLRVLPGPAVCPVGKESLGWISRSPALWVTSWEPLFLSCPGGLWGNLQALTAGNLIVTVVMGQRRKSARFRNFTEGISWKLHGNHKRKTYSNYIKDNDKKNKIYLYQRTSKHTEREREIRI